MDYPDSDGEPMAENTEQFDWIVTLKEHLDALLPGAFVAGDLFWYPVEGDNRTRLAPDVLVAVGRPKGRRGSYMQWVEANHPPDVVFEIWTPKSDFRHQTEKLRFYDRHGVSEFITWDHDRHHFAVFLREGGELRPVDTEGGWTSPVLGLHFLASEGSLLVTAPDGRPLERMVDVIAARGEAERARGEAERARGEAERERDRLRARLLALGIDPDQA